MKPSVSHQHLILMDIYSSMALKHTCQAIHSIVLFLPHYYKQPEYSQKQLNMALDGIAEKQIRYFFCENYPFRSASFRIYFYHNSIRSPNWAQSILRLYVIK